MIDSSPEFQGALPEEVPAEQSKVLGLHSTNTGKLVPVSIKKDAGLGKYIVTTTIEGQEVTAECSTSELPGQAVENLANQLTQSDDIWTVAYDFK